MRLRWLNYLLQPVLNFMGAVADYSAVYLVFTMSITTPCQASIDCRTVCNAVAVTTSSLGTNKPAYPG